MDNSELHKLCDKAAAQVIKYTSDTAEYLFPIELIVSDGTVKGRTTAVHQKVYAFTLLKIAQALADGKQASKENIFQADKYTTHIMMNRGVALTRDDLRKPLLISQKHWEYGGLITYEVIEKICSNDA